MLRSLPCPWYAHGIRSPSGDNAKALLARRLHQLNEVDVMLTTGFFACSSTALVTKDKFPDRYGAE